MKNKKLYIQTFEQGRDYEIIREAYGPEADYNIPLFNYSEIENIINNYYKGKKNKHNVTDNDFIKAIDTIVVYLYQNRLYKTIVDIDYRNKLLQPGLKQMTLEQIEKELGHPIMLVTNDNDIKNDGINAWVHPKGVFEEEDKDESI